MSKIKSSKGLFGQTVHYKDGVKVGETWDGFLPGSKKHYDANGKFVGSSSQGFFADQVHYDARGNRLGESWTDAFGTTRHYDDRGFAGTSYDSFTGKTSRIKTDKDPLFGSNSGDLFSDLSDDGFDW